jgi:hypothetical protein
MEKNWQLIQTPQRGDGRADFAIHETGERQNRDGDTIYTVATVVPSYKPEERPWIHDYTPEEATANAHLIAAAPDLYKTLETAHHALVSYAFGNSSPELAEEMVIAVEAALARARGEK